MNLKGVAIGSGYFSPYHYDAWDRIPEVTLTALASLDPVRGHQLAQQYDLAFYQDYQEMFRTEKPDFVDIITPPQTHATIARHAASQGIAVICQKPVTPLVETSLELIEQVSSKVRFIIHENFRFQPWHRKIGELIQEDRLGNLQNLSFRSRMGDGWGPDAYLARQPYFREYPQLLIYETGIHFIDVFRYHMGAEAVGVFAYLKQLNPVIQGEDSGLMMLDFGQQATALWDADRYHDHNYFVDRYTFGEYLVEGEKGSIRLYPDGKLTLQLLGQNEEIIPYHHEQRGFAGDSCFTFQSHAAQCLIKGDISETEASHYRQNLILQEAVYRSASQRQYISLPST